MSRQDDAMDIDDSWGMPNTASKQPVNSAFAEPSMVIDVSDQHDSTDQEQNDAGIVEDAEFAADNDQAESSSAVKPNYGILGLAGVLVLAMLGGGGYALSQKFSSKKKVNSESLVIEDSTKTNIASSVFDTPVVANGEKASGSVFGDTEVSARPSSPAASAPAAPKSIEEEPKPALAAPAAAVSAAAAPAPLVAAVKPQEVMTAVVAPVAAAAVAAPVTVPEVKPAVGAKAPVNAPVSKAVDPATPSVKFDAAESIPSKKAEPAKVAGKAQRAVRHTNRAPQKQVRLVSKKAKIAKGRKDRPKAPAKEMVELPRGLKVKSIYPQTGPNAQAWIAGSSGRVEVVRVGESLSNGAVVIRISGETGEVVTDSGTITSRGVR